jgi:hypothetical protein
MFQYILSYGTHTHTHHLDTENLNVTCQIPLHEEKIGYGVL